MKLLSHETLALALVQDDLEFVIVLRKGETPILIEAEDTIKPDRHLLIGLAQSVVFAVEESDPDTVEFLSSLNSTLQYENCVQALVADMLILRSVKGPHAVLTSLDKSQARKLAREALRWFTGGVRLDIP